MLVFYYFYMSLLPTLARITAKDSTFLISSYFDLTKLQKKIIDFSSTDSFPLSMAMETHIKIHIISYHITESKIRNSYFKNHDSTLMLSYTVFTYRPFQLLSISLLRVICFRSVLLSILLNYKKEA